MKRLKNLREFFLLVIFVSCTTSTHKETISTSSENDMIEETSNIAIDTFATKLGLDQPLPASFVKTLLYISEDVGIDNLTKDFSFDTLTSTNGVDLIFSSNKIEEGYVTFIFSHDDNYSEMYRHAGYLAEINKKDSVLVILDPDCCAGNNMRHRIVSFANKRFQENCCVYSIVDMEWPISNEIISVETVVDSAAMRMTSVVDDSTYNDELRCNGNAIGNFQIHTSGVSLSIKEDSLGQKWAFVLLKKRPYDKTHVWSIEETGRELFAGWILCRELSFKYEKEINIPQYLTSISKYQLP